MPGKFRFCLRCGATQATSAQDRKRLASLSAEGRSSATTVLVSSALRWMHGRDSGLDAHTRKLLGFTDNRQDAALQAGHFNDFLFVSLIRAGFLGALEAAGDNGPRSDELGAAHSRSALGFDRPTPELRAEWLLEPELKGFNLQEAEARCGRSSPTGSGSTSAEDGDTRIRTSSSSSSWRSTTSGSTTLPRTTQLFAGAPDVLRHASPRVRAQVYRELLDHLRKWMAIRSQVLDPTAIEQMLAEVAQPPAGAVGLRHRREAARARGG